MKWVLAYFTVFGFNFGFWMMVGAVRYFSDTFFGPGVGRMGKVQIQFTAKSKLSRTDLEKVVHSFNRSFLKQIGDILKTRVGDLFARRSLITLSFPRRNVNKLRIKHKLLPYSITENEVAVVMPAHNEEITIGATIASLLKLLPAENIHVGSDGSNDATVKIAKSYKCKVLDIQPNRGKAGAIAYTLEKFQILQKYKAALIVDADSQLDKNYLKLALPLFDDREIVAVAGHHRSFWTPHKWPKWSMFFIAHRLRAFRILQGVFRYGQTWKFMNVSPIIPGFASIYRTSALKYIDITAPGLVIEDFNMTFEVHHKKLGKIAYRPSIFGVTHDPYSFRDYVRQIRRWGLGFWQTVRLHGVWPSAFWAALGFFVIEIIVYGLFTLVLPFILLTFFLTGFEPIAIPALRFIPMMSRLSFGDLVIGILLVDYFMTVVVAYIERKPILLVYGLGFPIMRYVDAFIAIYTIPMAFFAKSTGSWISPKRK